MKFCDDEIKYVYTENIYYMNRIHHKYTHSTYNILSIYIYDTTVIE